MQHKLYTDGGARGNPGPAAIGGIIYEPAGKTLSEFQRVIGVGTNNQAEYQALIEGLTLAQNFGLTHLACYLDSELVVEQLNGHYKVKEPTLQKLFIQVHNLSLKFSLISFHHIPRSQNKRADQLVNQALDKAGS